MSTAPALAVNSGPADPLANEFRRRAFLAALTGIMASPLSWDMDGQPATRLEQRVELAWRTADIALLRSGFM